MADRMTEGDRYVREDGRVARAEPKNNTSWILIGILVVVALALLIWAFSSTENTRPASQTTIEAPASTPAPTTTLPAENDAQPLNQEAAPEQPAAPTVTEPAAPESATPAPAPAQ
jgi:hypothetical protein